MGVIAVMPGGAMIIAVQTGLRLTPKMPRVTSVVRSPDSTPMRQGAHRVLRGRDGKETSEGEHEADELDGGVMQGRNRREEPHRVKK